VQALWSAVCVWLHLIIVTCRLKWGPLTWVSQHAPCCFVLRLLSSLQWSLFTYQAWRACVPARAFTRRNFHSSLHWLDQYHRFSWLHRNTKVLSTSLAQAVADDDARMNAVVCACLSNIGADRKHKELIIQVPYKNVRGRFGMLWSSICVGKGKR
jgi:hypothetical protein